MVGGELREPELLAEALKAFFRKHKLPRQGVRLGIANNRIGVRIFEIAGIADPKQLENAIRFRAQEALPIPIEEAVLDYHVLGERTDDDGQLVRRILLVVAYRELIDRYVAACKKAGVRLAGIDLEAFALLRALGDPLPPDAPPSDAALVVVSVGHDRSTFAVSDGRVCEFTRVLDWGGSTLDVAIARELDCAPSEAEPFKRELSLAAANVPEGLTQDQADRAREAVRRQLQTFARELVSSLQFYQNQPGSLGIGEIVITGGTAHLGGRRRRAPAPDRRPRRGGRPAAAREARQEAARGRRAARLARGRHRPRDRGLTCARSTFCHETTPAAAARRRTSGSCSSRSCSPCCSRRCSRRCSSRAAAR